MPQHKNYTAYTIKGFKAILRRDPEVMVVLHPLTLEVLVLSHVEGELLQDLIKGKDCKQIAVKHGQTDPRYELAISRFAARMRELGFLD